MPTGRGTNAFNAFNTIDKCFAGSDSQAPTNALNLVEQHPAQSLATPQGTLAWSANVANWTGSEGRKPKRGGARPCPALPYASQEGGKHV